MLVYIEIIQKNSEYNLKITARKKELKPKKTTSDEKKLMNIEIDIDDIAVYWLHIFCSLL